MMTHQGVSVSSVISLFSGDADHFQRSPDPTLLCGNIYKKWRRRKWWLNVGNCAMLLFFVSSSTLSWKPSERVYLPNLRNISRPQPQSHHTWRLLLLRSVPFDHTTRASKHPYHLPYLRARTRYTREHIPHKGTASALAEASGVFGSIR